jgi:hypothetical protein
MRLIISLLSILFAVIVAFFWIDGRNLFVLVDIPSIIICIIFPLLFLIIIKGFSVFRSSFGIMVSKNVSKELLIMAMIFFKMYKKIQWLSCVLAVTIATICFLAFGEGQKTIGVYAAFALVSALYSSIIREPLKTIAKISKK